MTDLCELLWNAYMERVRIGYKMDEAPSNFLGNVEMHKRWFMEAALALPEGCTWPKCQCIESMEHGRECRALAQPEQGRGVMTATNREHSRRAAILAWHRRCGLEGGPCPTDEMCRGFNAGFNAGLDARLSAAPPAGEEK